MIRHGPPHKTVTPMVLWPKTPHVPFPELLRAQGASAFKTNAASNPTPHEVTSIGTGAALLDRQALTRPNHPKAHLPIGQRVDPAGSCTGGFRTQAPETLRNSRRSDEAPGKSVCVNTAIQDCSRCRSLPPT